MQWRSDAHEDLCRHFLRGGLHTAVTLSLQIAAIIRRPLFIKTVCRAPQRKWAEK
jgi:hypothetical protein